MSAATAPGPQALEGLRVIDVASFIAGPYCATTLSEFGAQVIKVEEPGKGDSLRRLAEQYKGEGLWWLQESRNKQTVTCDLRQPEGQDIFRKLVAKSDVVVENFRPGTMAKWGLGYDDLAKVNPGIIVLSISGYGQTGPYAHKGGFGRIAQAFAGFTYLAGFPDRPPVVPGTVTIADYVAGLYGAFAILVAKEHRNRTGEGQHIDVSLYESMFRILDTLAIVYDKLGVVRERNPFDAPHAVPHSHYPTKDGKFFAIACTNDKLFERLCVAMKRPKLATDPRFKTVRDRVAHRAECDALVTEFTMSHDQVELVRLMDEGEIPAGPINSIVDIFNDPHYQARNTIIDIEDEKYGHLRMPGIVPQLSKTPGVIKHVGKAVAADNEVIYGELLGYTKADLDALRAKGVI